jgi:threonylcarbamoyladenosine tRNA methylthiotransferase MtaB
VKERARRLREATARRRAAWLRNLVGTRQRVLVEKDGLGHAENFVPVQVAGDQGQVVEARIVAVRGDALVGVPA